MKTKFHLLCLVGVFYALHTVSADVSLPAIFSDHAVLQKSGQVPVWGWGESGEKVRVTLGKATAATNVGADGKWKVVLDLAAQGSGPYELVVEGKNRLVISDVLVGEVWVCSGQSNMEWPVSRSMNFDQEASNATDPCIRQFKVAYLAAKEPKADTKGKWVVCSPETVGTFTGVGYFFARELRSKIKEPVGLIATHWGGTPAEAWTPLASLEGNADFQPLVDRRFKAFEPVSDSARLEKEKEVKQWIEKVEKLINNGSLPDREWFGSGATAEGWTDFEAPGMADKVIKPSTDGSFWLRKVVDIPAEMAGQEAVLNLGTVDDYDETWINGVKVGRMGLETPNAWQTLRNYPVPTGTLKAGANVIVIRLVDTYMNGGFSGAARDLYLGSAPGQKISLAGTWQVRLETGLGLKPQLERPQLQNIAGTLYDGMIAPILPYGIKGVIWYQGESNAGRAVQYRQLFPHMITEWRKAWGQGDFPFYFVQLANFLPRKIEPADSAWAELREAQAKTLSLANSGMAVAIDIGEEKDIHPGNKQDVGRRLALIALSRDYGTKAPASGWAALPLIGNWFSKPLVYSGPVYREMKVEGSKIRLSFDHAQSGLINTGAEEGPPKGFSIAGADQVFVWAEAVIDGDSLLVFSEKVTEPVAVRYGWADNPEVSLGNKEGLPASPFRTDDFPAITQGKN